MKSYIDKIDALIDFATLTAEKRVKKLGKETKTVKGVNGVDIEWDYFTEFFHEEMDKLCREKGLRK